MFRIDGETVTFEVERWADAHGEPPRLGTVLPLGDGRVVRLAVQITESEFGFRVVGRDDEAKPGAPQLGSGFTRNEFVGLHGKNWRQPQPGVFTRVKKAQPA